MHTKDILAAALREVKLEEMAKKAETGYYHDFLSPLDLPEMQLAQDLIEASQVARSFGNTQQAEAIFALRARHMNGEFDANKEESDAWAASPEGQDAFSRLLGGK